MPRLIWSPSSLRDLRGIDEFLAERNDAAAARILRAIRAAALRLHDYPRIGRAIDEPFRVFGVRGTPYLLVYRLRDGTVEIVRVRHSRENWLDDPEGVA
jgi:plasmid stabilization system protein ParE